MGVNVHKLAGGRRARRATVWLCLPGRLGNGVQLFAAFVVLLGALIPSWHASQKMAAFASYIAELRTSHPTRLTVEIDCHKMDVSTSGQKKSGDAPLKQRPCPLCIALQLFSPGVIQPVQLTLAPAPLAVAAFIPRHAEPKTGREFAEQGRPRAPPLA